MKKKKATYRTPVCKQVFRFVEMCIDGMDEDSIRLEVKRRVNTKDWYQRFAEVPVQPRTIVLRLDYIKTKNRVEVFEVARTRVSVVKEVKVRHYVTSCMRSDRVEFFLPTL